MDVLRFVFFLLPPESLVTSPSNEANYWEAKVWLYDYNFRMHMCGGDAISNERKEASSRLQGSCGARRSSIDFMRLIEHNQASLFLYLKRPKHLCNWMAKHLTAVMDRIIIDMFY